MTKTLTTKTVKTALILPAAFALAGTAHAGDMNKTMKTQAQAPVQTTETVSVQTLDGALVTSVPADQQYAVLGVVSRDGETLYRIAGNRGDEFVNHVPADLTEVTTDVDVIDTYEYEYRGRTFTNRVVRDDADSVG